VLVSLDVFIWSSRAGHGIGLSSRLAAILLSCPGFGVSLSPPREGDWETTNIFGRPNPTLCNLGGFVGAVNTAATSRDEGWRKRQGHLNQ